MNNILVFGGVMVDHYMFVDKYPERGGDTTVKNEENYIGSTCYNFANAIKNLGANPIIYTHLGSDYYGDFIKKHLVENNFDYSLCFEDSNEESGVCHVVLDSLSERTFFSYPKCESKFKVTDIPNDILNTCKYIYVSGIFVANMPNQLELVSFLEMARKNEKVIIFDACPLVKKIPEEILKKIVAISSLIKANYEEYNIIKNLVKDEHLMLISDGRNGSKLVCNKREITHIAYPANVVDTNGAGDNFLAGYVFGYMNNYSTSLCLDIAAACGKIACETKGTTPVFTIDLIQKIIKENKQ